MPVTASCLWPSVVWFPLLLFMMTHNVCSCQNRCLANAMIETQSLPHGHRAEYGDVAEEGQNLGMGGIKESLVLADGEDFEGW